MRLNRSKREENHLRGKGNHLTGERNHLIGEGNHITSVKDHLTGLKETTLQDRGKPRLKDSRQSQGQNLALTVLYVPHALAPDGYDEQLPSC